MKKIFTLIITMLCAATLFAQAPEKFTYQAVVRNASNSLVANAPVGVRVSILQGGVNGTLVYMETHTSVTNANGLITLQIGAGSVQQGSLADIDWANGSCFLKTETDPAGGTNYSITSTQQMLSVPYALYAKDAGNIPTIPANVSAFANDAGYITAQAIPEIPTVPTNVSAFTNDAGYLTNYTETDPQFMAWDKDYNDLINRPTIPSVPNNVSAFTNDAGYITVQDIPTIPTVPTQVSAFTNDAGYLTNFTETDPTVPAWAKAANKPTYNYSEIINTPTIPTVPTQVSAFTNDAGYLTNFTETDPTVPAWAKAANKPTYNYSEIINTPTIPTVPTQVSAFTNDAGYLTSFTETDPQFNAWDKNYNDLTNKPILFSGNYNDLTNKPNLATVAISGSYNDLINKPAIPTAVGELTNNVGYITAAQVPAQVNADWNATTGAAQILNKPTLFSGNYNDLTNKPTIPTVPTNVSAFTNDAGYLTSYTETDPQFSAWDKDYNDLINKPTIPTVPTNVSAFTNDAGYVTSTEVQQAAGIPTVVSAFQNDAGYITAAQVPAQVNADWNATSGVAKILNKPSLFSGNYNDLSNKPTFATVATTGNYNDLTNKPTIPTVPSNVSVFNNDAHYITEAQLNALLAAMNNTIDSLRDRIEELEQNPQTPSTGLPSLITTAVSNVTGTSAQCGGNITADGGSNITERGVCWGVSPLPTVSGNHTSDGSGTGSFVSYLYGLQSGVTYYVRAYATNSAGTAYGNAVSFTTSTPTLDGNSCPGMETVTDYDGNVYNTVAIGQQCWMKENLRTSHYSNGTAITLSTSTSNTVPYRYNPGGSASNVNTYGYLYNWVAVMNGTATSNTNPSAVQGVCPTGWHVPSNMEWSQLTGYVSSQSDYQCSNNAQNIAKALSSTSNWTAASTILCAIGYYSSDNNTTGFSALPAGNNNGSLGTYANFWSCTQSNTSTAYAVRLAYNSPSVSVNADNDKTSGYSVRCVSDLAVAGSVTQMVVTGSVSNITANSAVCSGSVISDNGSAVTARGVCWSTSHNPTTNDNHTLEGAGMGSFTCNLSGLSPETTYYVRAYAVNGGGTAYGSEVSFTTPALFTCGTGTVTDYDGNVYTTVQIGQQCWMKENLRSTHYANGTAIANGSITSSTVAIYYPVGGSFYNGNLYNWKAVMGGASSSAASPSGVQGICPNGWHVPSDAEWTQLTNFVSGQSAYLCSNNTGYIAKALASTTGWESSSNTCAVGNNQSSNNATSFGALPAGRYSGGYYNPGFNANFWSSTEASSGNAWYRYFYYYDASVKRDSYDKSRGHSVRCLRD